MPGANARALEKGRSLPADVLIMDLEDGVLPDAKVEARGRVVSFLAEGGYGSRELVVRINGIGTPWFEDDLAAVAGSSADAAMLPKVEDPATVARAAAALEAAGAPAGMGIWCMLETPRGILDARLIAGAHPRMTALTLGTADLSKALQADLHAPDRLPLLTSIGLCVLAAREAGLAVLDAPPFRPVGRRGIRAFLPTGKELRFRRQVAAAPKDDYRRQRGIRPVGGGHRMGAEDKHRMARGRGGGQRRDPGRRQADRGPPRGGSGADPGPGGGDRGARRSVIGGWMRPTPPQI